MNTYVKKNPSRAGTSRSPIPLIDVLNNQLSQIQITVTSLSTKINSLNNLNEELKHRIIYLENVILTLTGIQ